MVHRRLFELLHNKKQKLTGEELEEKCRHSSAQERKAMIAERESVKYKQVEFMTKHIGEEFTGIISGITHFGIFVELKDNKCEGLIRTDSIRDELMFDDKKRKYTSMTGGRNFEMGDTVKVKIADADLDARELDFDLVE